MKLDNWFTWSKSRPNCALVSTGGVGSIAMGRRLDSIADPTDRKHAYTPSLFDNDTNIKLGFMYGNPYDAVLSVFRRGFQNLHSQAMNADSSTPASMLTGVSLE